MGFESAVILCGGKSSRMGFDKSKIKVDGAYVFEHIADQLAPVFKEIRLVVGQGEEPFTKDRLTSDICAIDVDIHSDAGPMGGVFTGLTTASSAYVFFMACDMPKVSLELIELLRLCLREGGAGCMGAVAESGGYLEPLCGFYSKALLPTLEARIREGNLQLGKIIREENFAVVEEAAWRSLGIDNPFGNLNHKSDLKLIQQTFGEQAKIEMPKSLKERDWRVSVLSINRCDSGSCILSEDPVIREVLVHLYVNGRRYATVSCLPGEEKAWAVGYLKGQGLLRSLEDLEVLTFEEPDLIRVILTPEAAKNGADQMALTSGCGGGQMRLGLYAEELILPIHNPIRFEPTVIHGNMRDFSDRGQLFKETGGVHSVALYRGQSLVAIAEDIGRHNAADKVIGQCLLSGEPLDDLMMLTTGRVSSDILLKVAHSGIPLLASRSAPTDMAVHLAERANLTLLGFVRAGRMNVYSGFERLMEG